MAYLSLILVSGGFIRFANKLASRKSINIEDGLVLGEGLDIKDPDNAKKVKVVLERNALDLGFLAIGGPGSGKSIWAIVMLVWYSLVRKIGWVYWEGKGDLDIYQKAVASGSKPDYFFSSDLEFSDTTNVVAGPSSEVIEALTQTLITSENEYYRTAQREALSAVVPLLKSINKPIILRDIYVALKVDEAAQYCLKLAKDENAPSDVIEIARQFFDKDPDQRANDVNGLVTKMSLFVTGDVAGRLNAYEPTLDLVKASKEGKRVYMHLPYSSISKDIAIFFTEQIGVIAKNRQLYDKVRKKWPQLFDDWGKFFYPNVGPITARCRSARMPVSYLFQSRGQTDAVDMSRIFTTEITDNIGGFYSFRINGQDSAKWVSEQFGTYETRELSSNSGFSGENVSTVEKPRVRADDLKDLDAGEVYLDCLVSGSGGKSENRKLKTRVPFPEMEGEDDIDWPVIENIKDNNSSDGLHLWRDFMNRERLETLKKEIVEDALNSDDENISNNETHEVNYL